MNKYIQLSILFLVIALVACVPKAPTPSTPSTTSWYKDADSDTYGDPTTEVVATNKPDNTYVADNNDCDDSIATGATINPSASEVNTDLIDHDCDGSWSKAPYTLGDYGPAGGIVFQTDSTNGLEAAPVDQDGGTGAEWGCNGVTTGIRDSAIGTGKQNTADMLAENCSPDVPSNTLAVDLVDAYTLNGYSDWFLPSKDELNVLYTQKSIIGGFANQFYWASSESDSSFVRIQHFDSGSQTLGNKASLFRVRAIRNF
jgi:hypothetical protein